MARVGHAKDTIRYSRFGSTFVIDGTTGEEEREAVSNSTWLASTTADRTASGDAGKWWETFSAALGKVGWVQQSFDARNFDADLTLTPREVARESLGAEDGAIDALFDRLGAEAAGGTADGPNGCRVLVFREDAAGNVSMHGCAIDITERSVAERGFEMALNLEVYREVADAVAERRAQSDPAAGEEIEL